jgi:hypothetical protein
LHEQHSLDWRLAMPSQKIIEEILIELALDYFRDVRAPPCRLVFSVMKSNASKLPRIAKDERAIRLLKNKMIMFFAPKFSLFDSHLSGHPEMQAKPIVAGKLKQHLFSARNRAQGGAAG